MGYLHCGPNGAGHFVKMVHSVRPFGVDHRVGETNPFDLSIQRTPCQPGLLE